MLAWDPVPPGGHGWNGWSGPNDTPQRMMPPAPSVSLLPQFNDRDKGITRKIKRKGLTGKKCVNTVAQKHGWNMLDTLRRPSLELEASLLFDIPFKRRDKTFSDCREITHRPQAIITI
ncbi:MAG: hypothetical protein OXC82_00605 [Rhodobacteraceae bacterium]|nr:hypothetical protein [Paracoccaceae bacterium]MCY4248927.1 hypothetical protein [Paracoccaceae bacterium]